VPQMIYAAAFDQRGSWPNISYVRRFPLASLTTSFLRDRRVRYAEFKLNQQKGVGFDLLVIQPRRRTLLPAA